MALNQNSYLPVNHITTNVMNNKQRQIAPVMKEQKPNIIMNNMSDGKYKKKYNYTGTPYPGHQTPSVVRRNARERNRVKQVNNGFANLRQHIPVKVISSLSNTSGRGASKKLSKVDTLKLAVEYIKSLQGLLDECEQKKKHNNNKSQLTPHSLNYSSNVSNASEVSVSPAPSYASDTSFIGNNNTYQMKDHFKTEPYDSYTEHQQSESPSPTVPYVHMNYDVNPYPIKKLHFDQYPHHHNHHQTHVSSSSPDDEELLDTIAWWQEQQ